MGFAYGLRVKCPLLDSHLQYLSPKRDHLYVRTCTHIGVNDSNRDSEPVESL